MRKIQYITLRIFLGAMIICAGLFLSIIWSSGPDKFTIINQLATTSFVVGFASFLIWLVTIILEIREKIVKR